MKTVNEGRPVCRLANYRKKNYTQLFENVLVKLHSGSLKTHSFDTNIFNVPLNPAGAPPSLDPPAKIASVQLISALGCGVGC